MLLGVNLFDFSGVVDDPCTSSLTNKLVKIKVTACGSGQFTCDDGQCVPIDERCNQISNCRFLYIFITEFLQTMIFNIYVEMSLMRMDVKC